MATHSSILVWRIPWTEEPGGLQSVGTHRVRHCWSKLACLCIICTGLKSIKHEGPFSRCFYRKKNFFLNQQSPVDFVVYECSARSCLGRTLRCQKVKRTHRSLDLHGPPSLGHWLWSPDLPKPGWSLQPTAPQPWAESILSLQEKNRSRHAPGLPFSFLP